MTGSRQSILLADDHPLVLFALSTVLATAHGLKIVGQCQDGQSALEEIRAQRPELALIDFHLPKLDGLGILTAVQREEIPTRVILFSASMADHEIRAAVLSGAQGLILKESGPETLLQCIQHVASGSQWFQTDIVTPAVEREIMRLQQAAERVRPLTPREAELALLVAAQMSNKEIANGLSLSEGTVKIHLHNLYRKLGIRRRSELIEFVTICREP
jgi:DNA-binding NarL/FixJ family response regulator